MRIVQLVHELTRRTSRPGPGWLVLIAAGTLAGGAGGLGLVLALIGVVPLTAGAFGLCLAAPLLRAPVRAR